MFEQLKQQYLASFEAKIANLEQALEDQDVQALTVAVHQLAGSSGSYGFDDIAKLCSEIESLVNDDSIELQIQEKTQRLINQMEVEINKAA